MSEQWQRIDEVLPELGRFYWVSDGHDVALATWGVKNMKWNYKYMHSVFKVKYMLRVKLPKPPKEIS